MLFFPPRFSGAAPHPSRSVDAPGTYSTAAGIPRGGGAGAAPRQRTIRITGRYAMEDGPVTQTQLEMKRQTFWESRTSGDAMQWQNLRVAADALLAGNGNVDLAETVLEAAGMRLQGNDLTLVYDMRGMSYELPPWVFRNPSNIVSEEEMRRNARSSSKSPSGPARPLVLKLRLSGSSDNLEQDIALSLTSDMTGLAVKSALHAHLLAGKADQTPDASTPRPNQWSKRGGLPPLRMRLLFRGRVIEDDLSLHELKLSDGDIVQVFIKPPPA